ARPMMRVDHVVADLEIDVDDFALDLEILDLQGCIRNGFPPSSWSVCRTVLLGSGLQIAVHEVDLLQAAKALADVLRPDLPHALDRLQLRIGGGQDLVQPAELAHDVLHHELREPWNAAKNAIPAGGDGIVQGVDL